jgi:hypothetical protein
MEDMMRPGLIFFLAAVLACGCIDQGRPAGVMSKEQYAAFLVDVYLAEARFSQLLVPSDSTMRLYLAYEPELLLKNGVSDSIVKLTYQYYLSHPKEMEQVYAAVVDTLSLREQRANSAP